MFFRANVVCGGSVRATIRWFLNAMLFAVVACVAAADESGRPNVLLICVDDLKPTIRCFGDKVAVTPNIDRLAARGVRFDAAYCNQAVCSPSRNALMTGLRPDTLGIYDLPTHFRKVAPDAVTLTQHFKKHGYEAQGLGKIYHVGHGNVDDEASWSLPSWRPKAPSYVLKSNLVKMTVDKNGKKRGPATESADVDDETYADGQIAREAIVRLGAASASPDQPFFLAVGFMKPHLPFVAPKRYWDLYDPQSLPMPEVKQAPLDAPNYAPTGGGELRTYSDIAGRGPIDDATTRHLIHGYYAATSYTDAQIGRLLDALDEMKLTDNTIVVLWGDHGWHLGDHGMWCKHTNYEQAARIPLVIAAPGKAAGAVSSSLIETVDVYPTLASLAGLPLPKPIDGIDQASVMQDPSLELRSFATHVYPRSSRIGRALRTHRYRLVEWKRPGEAADTADLELYDYELDPLETKNIAKDNAAIVNELRSRLASLSEAKPQWKPAAKTKDASASIKGKAKSDRASMFARRDADGDGFLSRDEFLKNQPDPDEAPKRFPSFDANQDGKLSPEEFIRSGKVVQPLK